MRSSIFQKVITFSILSALVVYAILVVLMNFVPPFMRDELTHHLFVPKLWLAKGKIFQIPELLASYYPMNIDLLYMIPLYFGNDIIPKFIHYAFGLLSALLIYLYLKKKINSIFALLGAFIFLSTPVILKLSISAYVDLGLVFFSWASFYFLIEWSEDPNRLKPLILAAISCGIGCGTKYNGLIVLLIMTLLVPRLYLLSGNFSFSNQVAALRKSFLFFIVSILIFSPWMIKNYVWTKNPIYPLYQDKISADDSSLRFSIKPLLQRKLIYNETLLETLSIPFRIFFQGQDNNPRLFDGKLNPLLLLFGIIPFILKNRSNRIQKEQKLLAIFALTFILFVYFSTDMRIRYIAPALPPIVILSVFGIHELFKFASKRKPVVNRMIAAISFAFVVSMLSINAIYLFKTYTEISPMPYLSGEISKGSYLEKRLPEYRTIQFANRMNRNGDKILALFLGNKGYYFDSNVVFSQNALKAAAESDALEKRLVAWLVENRYTHVIVGVKSFKRWVKRNYSRKAQRLVNQLFINDLKLLYFNNGYALYEIKGKHV